MQLEFKDPEHFFAFISLFFPSFLESINFVTFSDNEELLMKKLRGAGFKFPSMVISYCDETGNVSLVNGYTFSEGDIEKVTVIIEEFYEKWYGHLYE